MERAARLGKYHRKDYSQNVEFPVEIVGRDGRVRRYSYEDSVRLYQRRVRSAPVRLQDPVLVDAEVRHCGLRIAQLRRSFLEHHPAAPHEGRVLGSLLRADVIAALMRLPVPGLDVGTLQLVQAAPHGDVAWVSAGARAFLVYVYPLADAAAHDAFRAQRDALGAWTGSSGGDGEGVERLLRVHENPDVGVLITGAGPSLGPVVDPADELDRAAEGPAEAVALRALREGDTAGALVALEQAMEAAPGSGRVAVAAAAVALLERQPERAGFAAAYGLLNGAPDATRSVLGALRAIALFRLGASEDARAALGAVPPGPLAGAVGMLLDLTRFRVPRGLVARGGLTAGGRAQAMVRGIVLQRWALGAAAFSALAAVATVPGFGAPVAAAALAVPPAVAASLAWTARRILRADQHPSLLLGGDLLTP